MTDMKNENPWPGWGVYRGSTEEIDLNEPAPQLPDPPPWRRFTHNDASAEIPSLTDSRGATYQADRPTIEMVNAALYLRRPLLVTGKPGAGKSTLAYAVARELRLGPVLRWNITSRTILRDGLYHYDALGRLHDYNMKRNRPIGDYIDLGPLGTALLPADRPRVLLIDEIDKADIDLPNDLLNIFEEGYYKIPELAREQEELARQREELEQDAIENQKPISVRSADGHKVVLPQGLISCTAFPFIVLTSNGEREFSAPFLRRCLRLQLPLPTPKLLARIVDAHLPELKDDPLGEERRAERYRMINDFAKRSHQGDLATDQLLNAIFMTIGPSAPLGTISDDKARTRLANAIMRNLTGNLAENDALDESIDALETERSENGSA